MVGKRVVINYSIVADGWRIRRGSVGVVVDARGRELLVRFPEVPLAQTVYARDCSLFRA